MYLSHVEGALEKPGSEFNLWKRADTVQILLQNIRSGELGEGGGAWVLNARRSYWRCILP